MGQPRKRTFGLTYEQRGDGLLFMRPGTINRGDDLITTPANIGPPPDGDPIQWWLDASFGGAHFNAGGNTLEWRDDPGGVEFVEADGDQLDVYPGLSNRNYNYFKRCHTESFTWASLIQHTKDISGEDQQVIFATSGDDYNGGDTGFSVGIIESGGDYYLYAFITDGDGRDWHSLGDTPIQRSSTSFDSAWISQDLTGPTPHVTMAWNNNIVFKAAGFTIPSGTPMGVGRIGNNYNSTNTRNIDMILGGMVIDPYPNRGPAAVDWLRGNDYTPSSVTVGAPRSQTKLFSSDGGTEDTTSTMDMDT